MQKEASSVVLPLLPAQQKGNDKKVPIMTMDDGIGSRTILEEVESDMSGCAFSLLRTFKICQLLDSM